MFSTSPFGAVALQALDMDSGQIPASLVVLVVQKSVFNNASPV